MALVDMIGHEVSHYRILGRLGQGGMGVVYRAEDVRLGREVALKFLKPEVAGDPRLLKRFQLEARAASALNHPHICTVHDIDEHEGQHFIVMELLEGATLAEKLREGPLSVEAAVDAGVQITDALAAAHAKGIIHRDIKPGNVFLTRDGRVKLLDFGIAKLHRHLSQFTTSVRGLELALTDQSTPEGTSAGVLMGTVAYMSPEQLRGEELDARTDIFSTGALLYELATGRLPFAAATVAETAAAILDRDPAPPSHLDSTLPLGFDQVVLTALAKQRECRYRTAAALRHELEAMRRGQGPELAPGRPRWSRRRVLGWGGLSTAIVATALALTYLAQREGAGEPSSPRIESLAVLPLRELSPETEQSYLADGMTEALIARLSQVRGVRVISRTSAMRYKNTDKSLRQIGDELGVQGVVEGSVLASGARVRVTARLVRAADDRFVWSETYERELRDVLVLQGELAGAIARQIQVALTPEETTRLAQARRIDPDAHYLYLRGRSEMSRGTPAATESALRDFQAAVERDPAFALAWVGVADAFSWLCGTGYDRLPPREAMPRARAAVLRALEIEPSGEAHAVLADVARSYDRDFRQAEAEYEKALELSPGAASVHQAYSAYLSYSGGRPDEGIAEAQKAVELDPLLSLHETAWPGATSTPGASRKPTRYRGRRSQSSPTSPTRTCSWA